MLWPYFPIVFGGRVVPNYLICHYQNRKCLSFSLHNMLKCLFLILSSVCSICLQTFYAVFLMLQYIIWELVLLLFFSHLLFLFYLPSDISFGKRHCFMFSMIAISTLPLKFLSKWCFIYQNYKLKLLVLNGLLTQYMDYIIIFIILVILIIFKGRLLPFGEICLNDFKLIHSV